MSLSAAPPPAALEELRVKSDRRLVHALLLTMSFPAAFFAAIDLLGIRPGETSLESRLLSRALSLAVPLGGLWLVRRSHTREALSRSTFLIALFSVPVLIAVLLQQPRGSTIALTAYLMVLGVMYGALPNSLLRQIVPPLLLSAFLSWARVWWLNGPSDGGQASDLVVLAFLNTIGVIAARRRLSLQDRVSDSWRMEAEARERERAAVDRALQAAQELKALRGIIPICANCKQVRTDAGEWQQIERYVHEHSDANFSHGVCPTCAQRLYGEFLNPAPDEGKTGQE